MPDKAVFVVDDDAAVSLTWPIGGGVSDFGSSK